MEENYRIYAFEKLEVWKRSVSLSVNIYETTTHFPTAERYGLSSQIRRSVNSVSTNIAEGSARWSHRDKARFYQIAYSSLMETLNHLILSREFEYISDEIYRLSRQRIDDVAYQLNALHRSELKHLSEPEMGYGTNEELAE